jgi:hypothetical protein
MAAAHHDNNIITEDQIFEQKPAIEVDDAEID